MRVEAPFRGAGSARQGAFSLSSNINRGNPNILGRKNKLMKNRILSTLAIAALICGTAASCSDDNTVGGASLASLAASDPSLALAAAYAQYAGGASPASVDIMVEDQTAGDPETETVYAIAYNISVASAESASAKGEIDTGTISLILFTQPGSAFYIAGTNGDLVVGGESSANIDGNPYAVLAESLAGYEGPTTEGVFVDNDNGENAVTDEGTEAGMNTTVEITTPCQAIPNFTVSGTGFDIMAEVGTAESVDFQVGLDEVGMPKGTPTGDRVVTGTDLDIPLVNVVVTYDCTYTPVEA